MHEDLLAKRGFLFLDVHGDASAQLGQIIRLRFPNTSYIYFDATDEQIPWGYNPLRKVSPSRHSLVVSNILEIFERNWKSAWGAKMEHILRMVLLTLLQQPKANLSDILKLLHNDEYRKQCLLHIHQDTLRVFWEQEFVKYKASDLLPILNKVGSLLAHPIVKRILVDNCHSQISLRQIMDSGTILIINLARGAIGSDVSNILSGLLLTSLSSSAYSRIDTPEASRVPYGWYIDEFQVIATNDLIAELLAQVRKFGIFLILSNQFFSQLNKEVRDSILGNVGTIVCFRLGISDARLMEKEFYPIFRASDFTSLPNHSIYLRLMIDGTPSVPFSADTIL